MGEKNTKHMLKLKSKVQNKYINEQGILHGDTFLKTVSVFFICVKNKIHVSKINIKTQAAIALS